MEQLLEKSLTTTHRWQKLLHHNVTGMEYRSNMIGLAGLPMMTAEVLEGNSVARGRGVGSKLQAGLLSL